MTTYGIEKLVEGVGKTINSCLIWFFIMIIVILGLLGTIIYLLIR
jgi:hypothetical protein